MRRARRGLDDGGSGGSKNPTYGGGLVGFLVVLVGFLVVLVGFVVFFGKFF